LSGRRVTGPSNEEAPAARLSRQDGACWRSDRDGAPEFVPGRESWDAAAAAALQCPGFVPDVEEEQVADEARSCYNCRYRRWSATSFTCRLPASG
jgi:hypothetical protein